MDNAQAAFMEKVKKAHGVCHLLCYLKPGAADGTDVAELNDLLQELSCAQIKVAVHLFLGEAKDAQNLDLQPVLDLENRLKKMAPFIYIASVSGDYYRQGKENALQLAAMAIAKGEAPRFYAASAAMRSSYKNALFDEFMKPAVVADYRGMHGDDGVCFYGFTEKYAMPLQETLAKLLPSVVWFFKGD